MNKKTTFILAFLTVFLYGCGHNITLMARDNGTMRSGSAPSSWGSSGQLTIELNNKIYKGRWVYSAGGSFGLLNTYGANPTSGTMVAASGSGIGNALLKASDGSSLRCEFKYSEWTGTGIGVCQDENKALYDMQID